VKLIVQIPCFNEEATLPKVISSLPYSIPGISSIETLVIDDGSTDRTAEVARELGVTHVLRNSSNLGLALTFRRCLDESVRRGADIIVNIDGDNQYDARDIPSLIEPLVAGRADIAIGDRRTDTIEHFSATKRILQKVGSAVVRLLSDTAVRDTVSGFRAFTRDAALKLTILSYYTYTLESILQARTKGLTLVNVPVRTNPKERESRLMKSLRSYLAFSATTIIRTFTMYHPLRVFLGTGAILCSVGSLLALRFLHFYLTEGGQGKVQSLIFAAILLIGGLLVIVLGVIADLIQFNRRLLEDVLERVRRLELASLEMRDGERRRSKEHSP
jgi:glycosyltransferase involved in cell wall biosynthesis